MSRVPHARLCALVLAGAFSLPGPGLTEPISWSYTTAGNDTVPSSVAGVFEQLSSSHDPHPESGSQTIVLAAAIPFWNPSPFVPLATFAPPRNTFSEDLSITDGASHQMGTWTFTGQVLGSISFTPGAGLSGQDPTGIADLRGVMSLSSPASVQLGSNLYTVQAGDMGWGYYWNNDLFGKQIDGLITAAVTATPRPTPEPSALMLAALGLCGAGAWVGRVLPPAARITE